MCLMFCFKRTVSQDFLLQVFFHESSFPKPLRIKLGPFQFFSKIPRDILKSRYTTSFNDTVNFSTGTAGVVDTGGKFAQVGGPQISSANSKSVNLQTYKICNICRRSAKGFDCDTLSKNKVLLCWVPPFFIIIPSVVILSVVTPRVVAQEQLTITMTNRPKA